MLDITDCKRAEETQAQLVNELNHRAKSTLATMQSPAVQSFRLVQVDRAVRQAFEARLLSLARAHDVLTRESWEGAGIDEIARRVMEPFAGGAGRGGADHPGQARDLAAPANGAGHCHGLARAGHQ